MESGRLGGVALVMTEVLSEVEAEECTCCCCPDLSSADEVQGCSRPTDAGFLGADRRPCANQRKMYCTCSQELSQLFFVSQSRKLGRNATCGFCCYCRALPRTRLVMLSDPSINQSIGRCIARVGIE